MNKSKKIEFIVSIVNLLTKYLPQSSVDVKYWIACQFALESNFGQSLLVKNKQNYCGMYIPKSRFTMNIAVNGQFAKFNSLDECVLDYCYWLSWNNFTALDVSLIDLFTRKIVAKCYCPEPDYLDRVFNLYNSFKSNKLY